MNHLLRSHAPISDAGWSLLDEEARTRLARTLAARGIVDFSGPLGWEHSATNLGRVRPLAATPHEGVTGHARVVLPLVELRASFELSRAELLDADRGAQDTDLAALDEAARAIAVTENAAVLHGLGDAIEGIVARTPHERVPLGEPADYPERVAGAVQQLLRSGVAGPFALALGEEPYRLAVGCTERGGYPVAEHLRTLLQGGPIVWTPGLDGAVVLSRRGGDFLFECGEDLSIGYQSHDDAVVRLYIEESFSFRVATPEAAVALSA